MSDTKKPAASPDFLASPKRGKGVRRLNNLPLVAVGAIALAAFGGITYTFIARQQDQRLALAEKQAPNVNNPAMSPITPEASGPPEMPAEPVVPEIDPNAEPQIPPTPEPSISPELDARLKLIQRIEESRFAAHEAALGSEAEVQAFSRQGKGGPGDPNGLPGGMTPAQLAGAQAAAAMLGNPGGAGMGGGGMGLGGLPGEGQGDPNGQAQKRAFLASSPEADVYLKNTRNPALADTEVKAGTVIPGVMITGLNSDLPGQIVGQVRQNVFDSATGRYLLIPAGARLVGTYDSRVTHGQSRALVAWNRIIYPDGSSVSLDLMPGADAAGYAGFSDKTNNHYGRIFGKALLLSAFSAGVQISQPQSKGDRYSSREIATAELGRQLGQLGMETARRGMDIQPTIEIRPGYNFNINVTKDIILPVWRGHPMAK